MEAQPSITPLSPAIGVEISGIDLRQPITPDAMSHIRKAWEENCVALFRGQTLDEDEEVHFAEQFGPLARLVSQSDDSARGQNTAVLYVSNIRKDGKLTGVLPDGEMFFHSDQCYAERPAMATVLYAMEIPSQGGNTLFANGYRAYETLPAELKEKLAGQLALYGYDPDDYNDGSSTRRPEQLSPKAKTFCHPIFRTHPATGRKALFVNRLMTLSIVGMERAESDEILAFLFAHQEQRDFVYEHHWTPGDLLIWDNRSCLHARSDFDASERRRLRRVAVLGDKPYE
jgi:alpha-ketoglutarate-dependent taurine dioxygenase